MTKKRSYSRWMAEEVKSSERRNLIALDELLLAGGTEQIQEARSCKVRLESRMEMKRELRSIAQRLQIYPTRIF